MTHAIRPVDFDNLKTMTYEVTDRIARITFNRPEKGNAIIADTPLELSALVDAGKTIQKTFTPVLDASGQPKPWDIEFGFAAGKLWLFQCRPFQGNDQLKNIPALAPLDGAGAANGNEILNMKEILR